MKNEPANVVANEFDPDTAPDPEGETARDSAGEIAPNPAGETAPDSAADTAPDSASDTSLDDSDSLDPEPQKSGTPCKHCGRVHGNHFVIGCPGPRLTHGQRSAILAAKAEPIRVEMLNKLLAERGGRGAVDTITRVRLENYSFVYAHLKVAEANLDRLGSSP